MCGRLVRALFIVSHIGLAWYAWSSWSDALPQYKNEALFISSIVLYALAFPASLAVQLIYTGLTLITPIDQLNTGTAFLTWMVMTWGPLTIVGYLQWFVFVPRLVRYWRNRPEKPRDDLHP